MSQHIKTVSPYILVRRGEPDDLEAQVRSLKELQKQPGFIAAKKVPGTSGRTSFKDRWISRLVQFFRHRRQ